MKADDSASTFASRIRYPYYKEHVGSYTSVTLIWYDENGLETQDSTLVKTAKYTVEVDKRTKGPTFAAISVLKDPANVSGISLITPTDVGGLSSTAPLEGSFIIECPHPDNVLSTVSTEEIDIKRWTPGVEYDITN